MTSQELLASAGVRHSFGEQPVLQDVSFSVQAGELVAIIGPNGAGKSTLLRALGRLLRPDGGTVTFEGRDVWSLPPRELARRVAFLPQGPEAPADLVVEELAWRGRFPYRGLFGAATAADRTAVEAALRQAGVDGLRRRPLGTLSGGERQRAWVALALAQDPDLLLLDEPTTFLDIGHQVELLTLFARLNRTRGLTVVMAMHDLSQAAHYASRLLALRDGEIMLDGSPDDVVTAEHMAELFGVAVTVMRDPASGSPIVAPIAKEEEPAADDPS